MAEVELAELQDELLDRETVDALFADLAAHARVLDVLMKGGPRSRTSGATVGLEEARGLLTTGAVHGVQIRYRYDDSEWRDTLIAVGDGIRLIRMRMPVLPPPSCVGS